MGEKLAGKVVIVTGGGRGIGRGIALRAAEEGARVVVADVGYEYDGTGDPSPAPADEVAEEIRAAGGEAAPVCEDVSTTEGAGRIVQAALDSFGRLDGLVNCAGIAVQKDIWEFEDRDWDDVIAVHLRGHFACARAALPQLMEQGSGSLVFVSSSAAVSGPPRGGSYAAAKGGVLGFTWSCSKALRPHGITVNAIMPGGHTRLADNLSGDWGVAVPRLPPDTDRELLRLRRDPGNVAPCVLYLLSDAAANITGQLFACSGFTISRLELPQPVATIRSDGPWDLDDLWERFPPAFGRELSLGPYELPS